MTSFVLLNWIDRSNWQRDKLGFRGWIGSAQRRIKGGWILILVVIDAGRWTINEGLVQTRPGRHCQRARPFDRQILSNIGEEVPHNFKLRGIKPQHFLTLGELAGVVFTKFLNQEKTRTIRTIIFSESI